jgi:O-antigen ligase
MNKWIKIGGSFFLFSLPLFPWLAGVSFLFLLIVYSYFYKFKQIKKLLPMIIGIGGGGIFSVIFSQEKLLSLGAFGILLTYLLVGIIFSTLLYDKKKLLSYLFIAGIIGSIVTYFVFHLGISYTFRSKWLTIQLYHGSGTFSNPNRFAQFLLLTIPLGITYSISQKGWYRFLGVSFLLFSFYSLILTKTLSSMIGVYIGIVFLIFSKRKIIGIIFLILSLLCGYFSFPKLKNYTASSSTERRLNTWRYVVPTIIKTHPFTGCGLGVYKKVVQNYAPKGIKILPSHVHNLYFHYLCEEGILGILGFFLFMGWFFFRTKKKPPHKHNEWLILGGRSSVVGLLVCSCFETCLNFPQIGGIFFVIIGLTLNPFLVNIQLSGEGSTHVEGV